MKQRFSTRTRLVSALLTLAMVFTFLPFSALAAGETHANSTIELSSYYFPDKAFREYLKATFDKNGDKKLHPAERNAVKEIIVQDMNISNLYGIQFFPHLKHLDCSNNQLTELDVSKNTELVTLDCSGNELTSLDVHENTALEYLSCSKNQLTELNVRQNAALQSLYCYNNQLTKLDVSQNPALVKLSCMGNPLTSLNVSQNPALKELYCYGNQLTKLDASKSTELVTLDCSSNQLTSLNVSQNPALKKLSCYGNQLTKLDVSKNTALEFLSCDDNKLTSLDVRQDAALKELYCYENQLTELDVSQNTKLKLLQCYSNQLTSLDVSKNTALEELLCNQNQLSSLDVSQTAVTSLDASNNMIDINIEETSRTFDLSSLPGNFKPEKVQQWNGGSVKSGTSILTVDKGVSQVTYTYDCGFSRKAVFTLRVTETGSAPVDPPVTPPSGGDNPGGTTPGGSTGGGFKVQRFVILWKSGFASLRKMVHPNSVNQVKSDDKILRSEVLQHVLSYLILYLGLVIASFLLISLDDMDFGTAVSAVSTCINNIGPGMNRVGPMENFSFLSDFSKMVLSADMLLGRLEIFPILVLLSPSVWRKSF